MRVVEKAPTDFAQSPLPLLTKLGEVGRLIPEEEPDGLDPKDWSVPVRSPITGENRMMVGKPGVCLASTHQEVVSLMHDLQNTEVSAAMLSYEKIEARSAARHAKMSEVVREDHSIVAGRRSSSVENFSACGPSSALAARLWDRTRHVSTCTSCSHELRYMSWMVSQIEV